MEFFVDVLKLKIPEGLRYCSLYNQKHVCICVGSEILTSKSHEWKCVGVGNYLSLWLYGISEFVRNETLTSLLTGVGGLGMAEGTVKVSLLL